MPKLTLWATWLLIILGSLLVVLLAVFIAVMFSENLCWISSYLGLTKKNEILTFLGIGMGGILLALQAVIANRRAKAMEDTAKAQATATKEQAKANENTERGQREERLKNAIEHLGHDSDSVRLGGAYELFHLAQDTPDLRQSVMDILCAHIRRTTGEKEYRQVPSHFARVSISSGEMAKYWQVYPSKPPEEIQSLLTLLFVQNHEVFKGCHINLQGSWLNGARLRRARLQGANLVRAHLQGAELQEARLQGAQLEKAHLQGAELREACLHGAQLEKAHLQGANLQLACLHGANLVEAEMQVAYLHRAQLQGTALVRTSLQGSTLSSAHLQGAELWDASLQGADLNQAHMEGIHYEPSGMLFAEHIRYWAGKESMSHVAIFEGGVRREDVDSLIEALPNDNLKKFLRERLTPHIGKSEKKQLPKDSGAITGAYRENEAEQWIAEYQEAMSEVPKTANGQ